MIKPGSKLDILLRSGYSQAGQWPKLLTRQEYTQAFECLMNLAWQDYEGQIVEFLDDDGREEFGDKPAWETLQNLILNALEDNV